MVHVLLASTDVIGSAMAGPGIRAFELARILAQHHSVTLAVPAGSAPVAAPCSVVTYQPGQSGALVAPLARADVIIGQGIIFKLHPELLAAPQPIAIDLYDPEILESLHRMAQTEAHEAATQVARYVALTEAQLRRGDFFFCATERQRDYWLGALSVLGRLTPALMAAADPDLRTLIACVPSGIAAQPPLDPPPVLRGVHAAIPPDAVLLLWAGGLWDWFDPQLVVRAVAALRDECPRLRLCLFAGARPNHEGPPFTTRTALQTRALAAELGVLDQSVIMLDQWVPYAERGHYLAEADLGVSAHLPGIETRFAFRTRLLDYLWARLPVLVSAGDSLGDQLTAAGAGLSVAPGDLDGWCAALRTLYHAPAQRATMRAAADQLAQHFTWETVAQPLLAFCAAPQRTAPPPAVSSVGEISTALAESQAYAAHLEATLAGKERHIAALETLLHRIEHGRLMRILRAFTRRKAG